MNTENKLNELDDAAQSAFAELAEASPQMAMDTACGMLVGLVAYMAELHGHNASKEIKIEGDGESRSITIHAA